MLVFGLVALAAELGLDVLLGGFVAGMIIRAALRGPRAARSFESKLTAVGFGFLIPFFFVTSGINFDLDALGSRRRRSLKLPLFLGLFLVVRGVPALLLYRGVLDAARPGGAGLLLARPSCRWSSRSRRSPSTAGTCAPHRRRAGRRGDPLDADLPVRRPGAAAGAGEARIPAWRRRPPPPESRR